MKGPRERTRRKRICEPRKSELQRIPKQKGHRRGERRKQPRRPLDPVAGTSPRVFVWESLASGFLSGPHGAKIVANASRFQGHQRHVVNYFGASVERLSSFKTQKIRGLFERGLAFRRDRISSLLIIYAAEIKITQRIWSIKLPA